jgi:hypothetical protein
MSGKEKLFLGYKWSEIKHDGESSLLNVKYSGPFDDQCVFQIDQNILCLFSEAHDKLKAWFQVMLKVYIYRVKFFG